MRVEAKCWMNAFPTISREAISKCSQDSPTCLQAIHANNLKVHSFIMNKC